MEDVLKPLLSLGIDEAYARAQLSGTADAAARLSELASLAVESDACVVLSQGMPLPVALFMLVDGLRQAGLAASTNRSVQGEPMLIFEAGRSAAYEIKFEPTATVRDVIRTVAYILPRTHQLLIANDLAANGQIPVVVLNRAAYVALAGAIGEPTLDQVFSRAGSEPGAAKLQLCDGPLPALDLAERYQQRMRGAAGALGPGLNDAQDAQSTHNAIEKVRRYDPRVPWPAERDTSPGQDFSELCQALSGSPFSQALAAGARAGAGALAQLLFRFALATTVGAQCDLLVARRNPGARAQAVLGRGQLTWSYFIFAALGAEAEAQRVAGLLQDAWIRGQERAAGRARQRAYYDLALFLQTGSRGSCLLKLAELLPLRSREGWLDASAVRAAAVVHSEPLGDQLTHHPLYYLWPATLYALARAAGALDLLPKDSPFFERPLSMSDVDVKDALVMRLQEQLRRFDALDLEQLPPLLDPLPVIVDVEITRVDGDDVHGHTLLAADDAAEHRVVAPRNGLSIAPGEIWLLEVLSSRRDTLAVHVEEQGLVRCAISVPTGQWIERVSP